DMLEDGKNCDTWKLTELVREVEEAYGLKCELVVIDTLSRALAGGDENSGKDMGNFVKHVDRLRADTEAAVLVVHHSGKDMARGARGWSGIRAAVDTELEIHEGKLTVTKQRDLDQIKPTHFKLVSVLIGQDEDGALVNSCVVNWLEADEFTPGLTPG